MAVPGRGGANGGRQGRGGQGGVPPVVQQELIAVTQRRRLERRSDNLNDIVGLCHEMAKVAGTMISPQAFKKASFMMFMRSGIGQRGPLPANGRVFRLAEALNVPQTMVETWHREFLQRYPNHTGGPLPGGGYPRELPAGNPGTTLIDAVQELTINIPQGVARRVRDQAKAHYTDVATTMKAVNKSVDGQGRKRRRDAFVSDYDVKNMTAVNMIQQHAKRQQGRAANGVVEMRNRRNRNLV